jgi:hypothetical protein
MEGRAFSRFGLLGLLTKVGIEDGAVVSFLELLVYLRMDLTRSNFPGLCKKLLDEDRGMVFMLLAVADFVKLRGVPLR